MCSTLCGEVHDPRWEAVLRKSTGPEQDFLSYWYGTCGRSLRGLLPKYNYQLHQLFFEPDIITDRTLLRYDACSDDVLRR